MAVDDQIALQAHFLVRHSDASDLQAHIILRRSSSGDLQAHIKTQGTADLSAHFRISTDEWLPQGITYEELILLTHTIHVVV